MITVHVGNATIFCQLNELGEVLRQISGASNGNLYAGPSTLSEAINETISDLKTIQNIDKAFLPAFGRGNPNDPLTPTGEDLQTKAKELLYKAAYKDVNTL